MRNLREVIRHPRVTVIDEPGFEPTLDGPEQGGAFKVRRQAGPPLMVIASNMDGWDHVSVSRKSQVPTWNEMEMVKRIFFRDDEIAYQIHVPPKMHINCHPYCLHMWRCQSLEDEVLMPPAIMVGPPPS